MEWPWLVSTVCNTVVTVAAEGCAGMRTTHVGNDLAACKRLRGNVTGLQNRHCWNQLNSSPLHVTWQPTLCNTTQCFSALARQPPMFGEEMSHFQYMAY